jgi:hypothetical protein
MPAMRREMRAWVGIGGLGLVLIAGALACMAVETRLGLTGGKERAVSSHWDFGAVRQGMLGWDRVYESRLEKMDLWHESPRLARMQLEEGASSTNQCLWLSQSEQLLIVDTTTAARLCPIQNGTMMYVHQTFDWRR